ncbi:hypothetical protein FSW04_21300 [Baekduia soli]|uniref:DMT family transporter n=1 Tax=Baekduia soli TaxID=496014 RepID=A0A5B8UB57_9ACTN|nr:hypothetical protein [Baekduia soli]QEC49851.1 hypothetical protein FSW04_21300 [Baekduia soli]
MVDGRLLGGIAAAALAAACFDGAVLLQARAAQAVGREHGLRLSLLARLARRRLWVLGTAVAVAGWPLQLLALSWAPITVVQPTLALGLVVILLGGSRLLGERVGAREWGAVGAVGAGVAVLALTAPGHTSALPATGPAIAAGAVLAAAVALPFVRGRDGREGGWGLIVSAGCAFALAALTSKLLTVEAGRHHVAGVLVWAAATGAASAVGFLADMTAMQRFDVTRVAPPMFVLETALPVALSPVLFGERWSGTPGGGAVLVAGLVLVLGGGAVLGRSRAVVDAVH